MIKRINVGELKINPINPRKITPEARKKLQCSVMLFPKMLFEAKLITTDEKYVVLCGNQRTRILQEEILGKEPFSWKVVLQENEEYATMSEHEKEAVIDFWAKWCEAPVVPIDYEENLDEEQKKELIVKDNKEYGEYDYDKLEDIYDEVALVGMGFDEGIFYNPDDDPTAIAFTKGSKPRKIDMLSFGKYSVPVTREEYDLLRELYEEYVDEAGVDFGFIKELMTKNNLGLENQ
ncbi:hypothetical protein BFS16_00605 [Hoylesella timonensis]|uniref:ParB/Sulfiredoxin domain-containing protein n=1 Tax=Hoylesella timonensis TaxID=386414 RepID=A0A2K0XPF1_9BACT|nr:hypothetical protein [Hoylesella timonensis]PNP96419.1 hypothetical protein BFS16_00605 [Hoylesella timonensis]